MYYGIFSDIHSNLEALTVILNFLESKKVDKYICCGDIVGYGPNPNECVELIRRLDKLYIVAGNHDLASVGLKDIRWFNEDARSAILWTQAQLKDVHKEYIKVLPTIGSADDITYVHGSPREHVDEYLLTVEQMRENCKYFDTKLCIVGHSHVPFCYFLGVGGVEKLVVFEEGGGGVVLEERYEKVIVNVGSVGQPRDGDSRAACGIYDSARETISIYRLGYDVSKTQEKMRSCGLPRFLVERLSYGY
jgi:predicted phosphodiesterase